MTGRSLKYRRVRMWVETEDPAQYDLFEDANIYKYVVLLPENLTDDDIHDHFKNVHNGRTDIKYEIL